MKLANIINEFISGDWGNEEFSDETPNEVYCIRGADIVPITKHDFSNIPKRYVSDKALENKTLKAGDMVVEKSGGSPTQSTGRVVYISDDLIADKENVVCSNFCTAFRVNDGWNPYFVYQYWQYIYNANVFFNFEGKTSGIKNLQLDAALSSIQIQEWQLSDQNRIADILMNLESKMHINIEINQNLEAMTKQLYDYWFVQFNFPDENGKPYKSSGGKMVWNEKLKREIPKGWDVAKIQDIANTYSGGTPKSTEKDYYENGNIPWINSGELNETIITCTSNFITQIGLDNSSAKLYPSNTILIALYGATAGKVSLLSFEACSNQAICGVILKNSDMIDYTRLFLSSLYEHFITLSTGSARDNISQDTVKNTTIIVPNEKTLMAFNTIATNATKTLIGNLIEINSLTKQRDELLPLLMNGQVTVNSDLSHD